MHFETRFRTLDDVKSFTDLAKGIRGSVLVYNEDKRIVLDGKGLLNIYSLDLDGKVQVDIDERNSNDAQIALLLKTKFR